MIPGREELMGLTPSLQSLLSDAVLQHALRDWAENTVLGNMSTERLLALFRASCHEDVPSMERLRSCSLLTQWLKQHLLAGGADPRQNPERQHLLEMGVPLEAGRDRRQSTKAADKRSGNSVFTHQGPVATP